MNSLAKEIIMGYFSKLDLEMQNQVRIDRSYPCFSVLWAKDRSIDDLIMAVGEVAHSLKKAYREAWMLI